MISADCSQSVSAWIKGYTNLRPRARRLAVCTFFLTSWVGLSVFFIIDTTFNQFLVIISLFLLYYMAVSALLCRSFWQTLRRI
jgi:hypothetical protein